MKRAGPSAFLSLLKHNLTSQIKCSWLLSQQISLSLCLPPHQLWGLVPSHRSGMGLLNRVVPFLLQHWESGHYGKSLSSVKLFTFERFLSSSWYLEQSKRNKHFVGEEWDIWETHQNQNSWKMQGGERERRVKQHFACTCKPWMPAENGRQSGGGFISVNCWLWIAWYF